jgi:uncharacterized protein (DUF302 family)
VDISQDISSRQFQSQNFDDLVEDLVQEIEALNYRVTRINHIDNIHQRREAGIDVTIGFRHYKIVEFCNLNSCSELISSDLRAGLFMPVRFVVYQKEEETTAHISFLKPTAFASLFESGALFRVADQIEKDMINVLEEMAY